MLDAQLPLLQALRAAQAQTDDDRLGRILDEIGTDLESGRSLSESLQPFEKTFGPLYIHLVQVGETAGILSQVLMQLADYLEERAALRRKVKLALVYPGLVLGIALGATIFLLTVIVPTFADLFADFNAELPAATQLILAVSHQLTANASYVIGGGVAAVLGARAAFRTPRGRRVWDRLVLQLPLVGSLVVKSLIARFTRTFGTLLHNGIPLTDALRIQEQAAGNVHLREEVRRMATAVQHGDPLTDAVGETTLFPGMVIQMMRVGEKTAQLDTMLLRIARHYEEDVKQVTDTLTSVLEPVLIVIVGVLLGAILIALYLPMFNMMNVVQ